MKHGFIFSAPWVNPIMRPTKVADTVVISLLHFHILSIYSAVIILTNNHWFELESLTLMEYLEAINLINVVEKKNTHMQTHAHATQQHMPQPCTSETWLHFILCWTVSWIRFHSLGVLALTRKAHCLFSPAANSLTTPWNPNTYKHICEYWMIHMQRQVNSI